MNSLHLRQQQQLQQLQLQSVQQLISGVSELWGSFLARKLAERRHDGHAAALAPSLPLNALKRGSKALQPRCLPEFCDRRTGEALGGLNNETLMNLLMAWYYSGCLAIFRQTQKLPQVLHWRICSKTERLLGGWCLHPV